MNSHRQIVFALLLGLASVFGTANTGAAAPPASPPSSAAVAAGPVFAAGVSWYGFKKYWMGFVKNSDRVVVIVALVAAAALFIITRGKWMH
jgi:hypothetical protein